MRDTGVLYTPTFWLACAIHFTGGMSFGMFLLFPLFIRSLGGDEITIGLVLGTGIAASVLLRPTVGGLLVRSGSAGRAMLSVATRLGFHTARIELLLRRGRRGIHSQ